MVLLQLSAAQGPEECALAVVKAFRYLQREADAAAVKVDVLEREPGERSGTLRSVLLGLRGDRADELVRRWEGTVQWTCRSPYRPKHRRKNWFIGVTTFAPPPDKLKTEVRFETLRASGPGGQHVNTTDSAVRAIHPSTGIIVKVQSERSQHANRRLALLLISRRLEQLEEERNVQLRAKRRMAHHQVARGNPVRVFQGNRFEPVE